MADEKDIAIHGFASAINQIKQSRRKLFSAAYRIAEMFVAQDEQLQDIPHDQLHDRLVELYKPHEIDAEGAVKQWYQGLELINEEPCTLIKAVSDGLTLEQWIASKKEWRFLEDMVELAEWLNSRPERAN